MMLITNNNLQNVLIYKDKLIFLYNDLYVFH